MKLWKEKGVLITSTVPAGTVLGSSSHSGSSWEQPGLPRLITSMIYFSNIRPPVKSGASHIAMKDEGEGEEEERLRGGEGGTGGSVWGINKTFEPLGSELNRQKLLMNFIFYCIMQQKLSMSFISLYNAAKPAICTL